MLIRIMQEDLERDNLSWLCIEPMLLSVRGKNVNAKSDLYDQLNEGQKALYLFYAFHNHANTISEFYWFATYFISELKAWNGIKDGILFFGDQEMLTVLKQIEGIIEDKNKRADGTWREASPTDLEKDIDFSDTVKTIFNKYQLVVRKTIQEMNSYIRTNKEDFLAIQADEDIR